MKRILHTSLILASALFGLLLAACAPRAPRAGKPRISVSPDPYEVVADNANRMATVDLGIDVPRNYFSRRSRLVLLPTLVAQDSTTIGELKPVVLDASIYSKKKRRKEKLEKYVDPYSQWAVAVDKTKPIHVDYCDSFLLPAPHEQARIEASVTADGCGACTGFDQFTMASVALEQPVEPVVEDTVPDEEPQYEPLNLEWMTPEFVVRPKMMKGEGTAHLQFIINKYDIVPELGQNNSELEQMVARLEPILTDTLATITHISIYGMASADGPLSFNTPLSRNRALSAKEWLAQRLNLTDDVVGRIETGSRPEGWQPVLDAMTAAGNPDSVKVKEILVRYSNQNDDVQERYIRRLACWPTIRDRYLQKDRKVDYTYAWTIRSFTTDEELISMYRTRPDAFNEDELLRVAQLAVDDNSRISVYRYTLSRYPTSRVAANNLAILLDRNGKPQEARQIIEAQRVLNSINEPRP